jgi:hypothetical protein
MNDLPTRHEQERAEWLSENACAATDLESSLLRDIELLRQHHGALHPELIERRNCLAGLHELAGRTDQALSLYREHLADLLELLGPDDPATRQTQALLDALLQRGGVPTAAAVPGHSARASAGFVSGLLLVPTPARHPDRHQAVQSLIEQLRNRNPCPTLITLEGSGYPDLMQRWPLWLSGDPDVMVMPWLAAPDLNVADPDSAGTALVARLLAESRRRIVLIGVEASDIEEAQEVLIDWHEPSRQVAARRLMHRTRIDASVVTL